MANPSRRQRMRASPSQEGPTPHPSWLPTVSNSQLTTSKLGKHSSLRTRHVSKDVMRMSLEQAESFTSDQVTSAVMSCRSSIAYSPDTLSIFHLKTLGPLAARTHHKAPHTDPSRCYAQLSRFSRRSSYPQSTNLSHQLKINTASDPDTLLHLPSSSLQQTSRQASTSGNNLTVQCVWP